MIKINDGVSSFRHTLTAREFIAEVYDNLDPKLRYALSKSPRFKPTLKKVVYDGIKCYCFSIERSQYLFRGIEIGKDSEMRYRIEEGHVAVEKDNLGEYRRLTFDYPYQGHSGDPINDYDVVIAEYNYAPSVSDTLVDPTVFNGYDITYHCSLITLYLRPFNLTKGNAVDLASYIKKY